MHNENWQPSQDNGNRKKAYLYTDVFIDEWCAKNKVSLVQKSLLVRNRKESVRMTSDVHRISSLDDSS